jgi:membrane-associated protease RseP (regulator of RpoE activity)
MIGRYRADEGVAVDGVATAAELEAIVREANLDGLKISTTGGAMSGRSDHATFIAHGVPAIHLFTGAHVDYHKPSDDADKLDAEGMAKVAAYAGEIARRLANADARLAFVKPKPKESQTPTGSGFGAWFGSIPSYAQDEGGVKLSGVSAGSPAEKAGIKGGDVLIGLGDVEIDNIQDFTNALRMKRPGDEVEAVVLRGDEKLTFKVVLGRR